MALTTIFDDYGTLQKLTVQRDTDTPVVEFTFPLEITPEHGDGTHLFGLATTTDFYQPDYYTQDTYRLVEITSTTELSREQLEEEIVQALATLNSSTLFNLYSFALLDISQTEHTVHVSFVDAGQAADPIFTQVALPDGTYGWIIDTSDITVRDTQWRGLRAQFSRYLPEVLSYTVEVSEFAVTTNFLDRRVLTAQPGVLHSLYVETLDFEHRLRLAKATPPETVTATEDDIGHPVPPMEDEPLPWEDLRSPSEFRHPVTGVEAIEDGVFEEIPPEPHTTH